jgi:drug/metabolite transporter (DMT)-like permease
MIDWEQRHRRRVLGWVLLALAGVVLVAAGMVWSMFGSMMVTQASYSFALIAGLVLVFLALAGSGAYLVRKMRGE